MSLSLVKTETIQVPGKNTNIRGGEYDTVPSITRMGHIKGVEVLPRSQNSLTPSEKAYLSEEPEREEFSTKVLKDKINKRESPISKVRHPINQAAGRRGNGNNSKPIRHGSGQKGSSNHYTRKGRGLNR